MSDWFTKGISLVDGEGLLIMLFPEEKSRPTLRWLRKMTSTKAIPFIKIGNRVWFDVHEVREHFDKNNLVKPNKVCAK